MDDSGTPGFVVVGDPIEHSLSPQIHHAFADQFGIELEYAKVRVTPAQFDEFFDTFWTGGGVGANVTVPLKSHAHRYADTLDDFAIKAGAVNTLARRGDQILGFNTDGIGLCRDLTNRQGVPIKDAIVLVLGAGGAARGIVSPLLEGGVSQIVIANRTVERAQALSGDHGPGDRVVGCGFDDIGGHIDHPTLIINATSFALDANTQDVPIGVQWLERAFCYDMSYGDKAVFAQWSRENGAIGSVDGLGMLVEQAAIAFEIWHGVAPATSPVMDDLHQQIGII
ncbi:MAG: shikimate dehydrogenase [Pseudomonadota bacterium]